MYYLITCRSKTHLSIEYVQIDMNWLLKHTHVYKNEQIPGKACSNISRDRFS